VTIDDIHTDDIVTEVDYEDISFDINGKDVSLAKLVSTFKKAKKAKKTNKKGKGTHNKDTQKKPRVST